MASSGEQGRCGFVALVGRPNVGKSTLMNRVLGEKIAIVSRRPQTTRNRILGVSTRGADQLVMVDTPGIHRRRANLNQFMVREALDSVAGVDCVLLVTEIAARPGRGGAQGEDALHPADRYVLEQVRGQEPRAPIVVAINKIDLLDDRRALLPAMAAWGEHGHSTIVPISARTGDGVDRLLGEVLERLPRGPHLYPEEMLTDRAERFLAAELIREQVFRKTRQEIPYSTAVVVDEFRERSRQGDVWIEATIHVERDSQKAVLIGKGGAFVKTVGTAAREQLSRLLGCPVHLKLRVHVEPNWSRDPAGRRKLGYE